MNKNTISKLAFVFPACFFGSCNKDLSIDHQTAVSQKATADFLSKKTTLIGRWRLDLPAIVKLILENSNQFRNVDCDDAKNNAMLALMYKSVYEMVVIDLLENGEAQISVKPDLRLKWNINGDGNIIEPSRENGHLSIVEKSGSLFSVSEGDLLFPLRKESFAHPLSADELRGEWTVDFELSKLVRQEIHEIVAPLISEAHKETIDNELKKQTNELKKSLITISFNDEHVTVKKLGRTEASVCNFRLDRDLIIITQSSTGRSWLPFRETSPLILIPEDGDTLRSIGTSDVVIFRRKSK